MVHFVRLPQRLKAIAGYIKEGAAVVDVGSDHGLLPIFLAQCGNFRSLTAADISADSLDSARRNVKKYDVSDKVELMVADGLTKVSRNDVDTIVISGLGGETIRDILQSAPWTIDSDVSLILQPQSKIDVLCNFLYNSGYSISETHVVVDRGRRYTVIKI